MEELLSHPAVQGGVAPFIVAFIVAGFFLKVNVLAGLAIVAGFVTTVVLTTGISFEPLTSTRKITLVILLVPLLALFFQLARKNLILVTSVFYVLVIAALLWMLWPVINNKSLGEIWLPVLTYIIYATWMVKAFLKLSELPAIPSGTAATAVGAAIGGAALIGASALLGQMGLALAAAGGAFLFIQLLIKSDQEAGYTVTSTAGFIAALVLPASIEYAKVPWLVLPLIALVPLFAFYPFEDESRVWKNTISLFAVMAFPIALALYLVKQHAGEMMF